MSKTPRLEQAKLVTNRRIYQDTFLAWLESPSIAASAGPGQFVMVACGPSTVLRRPLAVHRVDAGRRQLALLYRTVGKGTGWLSVQQPGTGISLLGPLGNGFSLFPGAQNILLVTGGLGIAPLCFFAEHAASKKKSVIMLQGAATASGLYPDTLLPEGITCFTATEDGSAGSRCLVTGMLHDYLGWADQIVACGPSAMYHPIARKNSGMFKTRPYSVSLEVVMGCGFGACYGCSIKTLGGMKKVCKDGPVFDYYDIIWDWVPEL